MVKLFSHTQQPINKQANDKYSKLKHGENPSNILTADIYCFKTQQNVSSIKLVPKQGRLRSPPSTAEFYDVTDNLKKHVLMSY